MTTIAPALDLEAISARYFGAWADHDPDRIVELHTEDTQYWSHVGEDPVRGKRAVRDTFAAVFQQFPEFGFEVHRVLYGPDFWILDWALTAVIDGRAVRFDALDVVNVSPDGLVERKDTFIDVIQAQTALKGPSSS
jgi:uncharacterized protein (TIGR02246 family)